MKILSITVVTTKGRADIILFETDLPEPIWPFKGNTVLKCESATTKTGVFLSTYFPGVPVKKVGS
jgi:hypothetical protein